MIPVVPKRASLTKRRFVGFVICWRNKMFVSRRPNSVVNAGFWEFPNWEVATKVEAVTIAEANLSLSQAELKPLCHSRDCIVLSLKGFINFLLLKALNP